MTTSIATKWTLIRDDVGGHSRSIPGHTYDDRTDAMIAAVAIAEQIAGPHREDYRRPVVAIIDREPYGACVHIDNQDHFTLIVPVEHYVPVTISP